MDKDEQIEALKAEVERLKSETSFFRDMCAKWKASSLAAEAKAEALTKAALIALEVLAQDVITPVAFNKMGEALEAALAGEEQHGQLS